METQRLAGVVLTVVGLLGYGVGVYVPYPGRAFSLTVLIVGLALTAVASAASPEGSV